MRANNLKKGLVILFKNEPCKIIDFNHVTPGKGQAVCQAKLRNLITGIQTETRFGATESVEIADIFNSKATYLYSEGDLYHFMDTSSYEQFSLSKEILGNDCYYLLENTNVDITSFEGNPISIGLPTSVNLKIVKTEPGLKGATVTNSNKPAETETGLQVMVPPFIEEGEIIKVDTAEGKYMSRANEK